jgi:hypothetical protein
MWEMKTDDGGPRDKDNPYTWQQALTYCENLILAGYSDWRLPNRNELQSIVDYSRYNPAIDPVFNAVSDSYWSSTSMPQPPFGVWIVYFSNGEILGNPKSSNDYVRAVRGGLCGALGDVDGDTVCDNADNCIDDYNPFQIDCDTDGAGDICDPDTIDTYPPQGNGIGDACDCEGNFNCTADQNVDGMDAATFKADYDRDQWWCRVY